MDLECPSPGMHLHLWESWTRLRPNPNWVWVIGAGSNSFYLDLIHIKARGLGHDKQREIESYFDLGSKYGFFQLELEEV